MCHGGGDLHDDATSEDGDNSEGREGREGGSTQRRDDATTGGGFEGLGLGARVETQISGGLWRLGFFGLKRQMNPKS